MKAVKVRLYQNMVNYRREMSYGYVQTYPLPTPSMVKGMCHSLLNLDKYYNLKISIQGDYETIIMNMQKVYKFDRDRKARPKNPYNIVVNNSSKTATHGVMFVDLIININLILHIKFDDDNLNNELFEEFQKQTIVLGRNEDIARIDDVKMLSIHEKEIDEPYSLKNNIYINPEIKKKSRLQGTNYRLPFYYEKVDSFKDKRIFKFADVSYIIKHNNSIEEDTSIMLDEDNDIVSLLGIKHENN